MVLVYFQFARKCETIVSKSGLTDISENFTFFYLKGYSLTIFHIEKRHLCHLKEKDFSLEDIALLMPILSTLLWK